MLNIIIEEIAFNPVIQIEEVVNVVAIEISEMQVPGANGLDGYTPIKGVDYFDGLNGADGLDGKSAYQSAIDSGFVGTELEFNTFLAEIGTKANDSEVVHLATDETISGIKTFFRIVSQIFDYTPITAPAWIEGRSFYDNSAKSLVVYDDVEGTSLNVGQELILRARNNTGATILNGSVVYITGATGQNPTISLAKANALSTSVTVGMATHDVANNTIGKITTFGLVNDLNTSSFTDGALLFLSPITAGLLTTTVPSSPNYSVYVGIVAYSHINNGKIFIRPEQPISLNALLTDGNNVTPSVLAVKTALNLKADLNSPTFTGTVSGITKAMVGLSNVDNTSDANKSISTATATALGNKASFAQVNTYELMIAIVTPTELKIVKVLNDENKGITNAIYHIYPDGVRMWIAANKDN
jgi:hypothetical protein